MTPEEIIRLVKDEEKRKCNCCDREFNSKGTLLRHYTHFHKIHTDIAMGWLDWFPTGTPEKS